MDVVDMSAPTSPLRQILQMLQLNPGASLAYSTAQLAAALGLVQHRQQGLGTLGILADLEASLSSGLQQTGPQLLSDYRAPF